MKLILETTFTLNNGLQMPVLGLGVWQSENGAEVESAIDTALEVGYRSIDTAAIYKNESGVGKAVENSAVAREEIFVTSKVWNKFQGYDSTLSSFDRSLDLLGMDYLDMYLIHWPVSGKFKDTWRALEAIYKSGRVKAIGVSNFLIHHLEELMDSAEITPVVNQVEFHPYLIQQELLDFCTNNNIRIEAWSPLMQGKIIEVDTIVEIGRIYKKSAAQVVLRWNLQRGVITIPKSVKAARIKENADIFDFELSDENMARINALDKAFRQGPDPDNFDF